MSKFVKLCGLRECHITLFFIFDFLSVAAAVKLVMRMKLVGNLSVMCLDQGYEGERNTDPNSKKMAQAKLGLDRNANKKKKKKKVAVMEEGPSKATKLFLLFLKMGFECDENDVLSSC